MSARSDSMRSLSPTVARWIPRLVLSAFAAALAVPLTIRPATLPSFELEVTLATTANGTLQVFYDRGSGLSEAESVTTPIGAASGPLTYRMPIPNGVYRAFRIDPNSRGGRYSFTSIRILLANGRPIFSFPLNELRATAQATLTTSANSATAVVPDGANDPQLIYEPSTPLTLTPRSRPQFAALAMLAAAGLGLVVAFVLERVPFRRTAWISRQSPPRLVAVAGLVAAIVATYPLFLGRSLVSPNNGSAIIFYDQPPFTYRATDFVVEDTRGSDVGSMMWAILPYSVSQREAVASGELPLWNRYNAIGLPLWGQAQHFFLEPLHLISLAIGEPSYYADVTFVVGRIVFAVGAGLAALVATGSPQAGALVAASAPFIGHFSFRFNHPAYFSIVYAPWILWAYFRLATRRSTSQLIYAGVAVVLASVLQMVGSTPKEGIITFAVAQLTGFVAVALAEGTASERRRRLATAAAAVLLTMTIAAPHWLIFLDTLARARTAYEAPTVTFNGWRELASLALGPGMPGMPYPSLNGVVAVLAMTALLASSTLRHGRAALACVGGGIASVAIASGAVPATVMLKLPLLSNIHHFGDVFLTAALTPLLVGAGAGLVALRESPTRGLAAAAVGTLLLIATVALGVSNALTLVVTLALVSLSAGVLFALLYATACAANPRPIVGPAMAIVLTAGLLPGGLQLETGFATLDSVLLQPRERVHLDAIPPSVEAVRTRAAGEPFRVASIENVLFPGSQAYYRLEGITGPDALQLRELNELSDAAGILRTEWGWRTVLRKQDLNRTSGLLDMLGVRFVFGHAKDFPNGLPLSEPDTVHVIERPSAWPRAFFVNGVRRHTNVSELIAMLQSSSGPFASIDRADPQALGAASSIAEPDTLHRAARDYRMTPNRTTFVIDATGPGVAVLAEAYVPRDFRATLNGTPVAYFRVNHALKALIVPSAGTWTITFEYRPEHWTLSWIVSLIGIILTTTLSIAGRRAKQSSRVAPVKSNP